jgi:hypothetical protein
MRQNVSQAKELATRKEMSLNELKLREQVRLYVMVERIITNILKATDPTVE